MNGPQDEIRNSHSVLVIGGSGAIGKSLLGYLRPDAETGLLSVKAAVRSDASAQVVREHGAEPVRFDLDDRLTQPKRHVKILKGVDAVFLLTGYTVDMLAQSKAIIDAAVEAGVKHIVHLGLMALPDTRVIHQGWHQMIEAYLERSGLGWTHLHPNMFMTAFPAMQMQCNVYPINPAGKVIFMGYLLPHARVSWIATEDIAQAAAAVLRDPGSHHGKTYNLAAESMTFPELTQLGGELLGREFDYEMVPVSVLREALLAYGMEAKYVESAVHTMTRVNAGLLPDFGDVHDDHQRLTGHVPTYWRDMIRQHPEWFGM